MFQEVKSCLLKRKSEHTECTLLLIMSSVPLPIAFAASIDLLEWRAMQCGKSCKHVDWSAYTGLACAHLYLATLPVSFVHWLLSAQMLLPMSPALHQCHQWVSGNYPQCCLLPRKIPILSRLWYRETMIEQLINLADVSVQCDLQMPWLMFSIWVSQASIDAEHVILTHSLCGSLQVKEFIYQLNEM
jgi:hypothetical protein